MSSSMASVISVCRSLRIGSFTVSQWSLKCSPQPHRYYSDEEAERYDTESIPRDKLTISFSKSSGPGGQNVNKLNTKAEVRFHLDSAEWISDRVRERIKKMCASRLNKAGELLVVSQKHRSQIRNVEDAISKLSQLLEEAAEVPQGPSELTMARVRALKRKAERQRLVHKKYHSLKKTTRKTEDL